MSTELIVSGHKINIQLRDVLYVIGFLMGLVGAYYVTTNRLNIDERELLSLHKTDDEVLARLERMDTYGSRRSHEIDATQQQQIDMCLTEIAELQRSLRDLTPKVDKIDTNVLWLMQQAKK